MGEVHIENKWLISIEKKKAFWTNIVASCGEQGCGFLPQGAHITFGAGVVIHEDSSPPEAVRFEGDGPSYWERKPRAA